MALTDELLGHNDDYASDFDKGDLPMPPGKKVAVLACMDARLDPAKVLGLDEGDAHVIRNAGGVVSEDSVRSLVISQRLLGTEEIVLIHHTDCGMLTFDDNSVKDQIEADTGLRPSFALEAFPDVDADVRQSIARIQANPFIPKKDQIRGFVYEVETGKLREVGKEPPKGAGSAGGGSRTCARAHASPRLTSTTSPRRVATVFVEGAFSMACLSCGHCHDSWYYLP